MASFEIVEQLETELLEKEQLIAALTTSLEQAANELDRARRHSGPEPLFSEPEEEVCSGQFDEKVGKQIQEQHSMLREVRDNMRVLHAVQPGNALSRIEFQLDEIRGLIEHLAVAPQVPTVLSTDWKESLTQQMSILQQHPVAELLGLQSSGNLCGAKTETGIPECLQKATEEADDSTEEIADSATGLVPPDEVLAESVTGGDHHRLPLVDTLPDIPNAIDLENSDLSALKQAILERDECIQSLQDYIEALNTVVVPEFDLKDYDSLPVVQRQKLENWEAVMRENMRRTEVELSVERAKIAREQQKLQFQQLQLAKERKRMGMKLQHSANVEGHEEGRRLSGKGGNSSSRTWLSLFHRQEPTPANDSDEESGNPS